MNKNLFALLLVAFAAPAFAAADDAAVAAFAAGAGAAAADATVAREAALAQLNRDTVGGETAVAYAQRLARVAEPAALAEDADAVATAHHAQAKAVYDRAQELLPEANEAARGEAVAEAQQAAFAGRATADQQALLIAQVLHNQHALFRRAAGAAPVVGATPGGTTPPAAPKFDRLDQKVRNFVGFTPGATWRAHTWNGTKWAVFVGLAAKAFCGNCGDADEEDEDEA